MKITTYTVYGDEDGEYHWFRGDTKGLHLSLALIYHERVGIYWPNGQYFQAGQNKRVWFSSKENKIENYPNGKDYWQKIINTLRK